MSLIEVRPITPTHRGIIVHGIHTGAGLCYGLDAKWTNEPGRTICGNGYAFRAELGCLDAPDLQPGGAISIIDDIDGARRWVKSAYIPRPR